MLRMNQTNGHVGSLTRALLKHSPCFSLAYTGLLNFAVGNTDHGQHCQGKDTDLSSYDKTNVCKQ